jgi:hypothetical protein
MDDSKERCVPEYPRSSLPSLRQRIEEIVKESMAPGYLVAINPNAVCDILDASAQSPPARTEYVKASKESATLDLIEWLTVLTLVAQLASLALQAYEMLRKDGLSRDEAISRANHIASQSEQCKGLPEERVVIVLASASRQMNDV